MPKIITLQQRSPTWLSWRYMKIGASMASVICDKNPYETPYQLWTKTLDGGSPPMNDSMQKGIELEPLALDWINSHMGTNYAPACMEHHSRGWQIASLDGWDEKATDKILEIKCPGEKTHKIAMQGNVPDLYIPQLQHQMEVAGEERALYLSYFQNLGQVDVQIIQVFRDDKFIKKMNELEEKFYECLINCTPPELVDRDYPVLNDPDLLSNASALQDIRRRIKELEKAEEMTKSTLFKLRGELNSRRCNMKFTRGLRKGAVEYDKIPELKAINLEQYRKEPVQFWRISEK